MELNYVFTEQDFEFYKLVTLETLQNKVRNENRYHVLLVILYLILTFFGFTRLGINEFIIQWITLTFVFGFLYFITTGKRVLLKRYQHVTYVEKENQKMFIELSEDGIYLKDFENYEYYLFLNKITSITKAHDYLVIYTKKENMIIPLRAFPSQTDYETFMNHLLSKTKPIQIIEKEYKWGCKKINSL